MNLFRRWADHKRGLIPKILLLAPAEILFAFLLPYSLLEWLPRLDDRLRLPPFSFGLVNYIVGAALIVPGMVFALWSIGAQLFDADGTPVPLIPTKKLLVDAPFSLCRNPMSFGTFCAYLGFAIIAGSITAVALVVVFAALLILYIKKIEEKALAARFGQEYLDYKASTPFIVPRFFSEK